MGKHGPCCHCGVTSTPLWRNGPPEKPVLCNACGSRWRTKGTLANYTPLHARAEPDDFVDYRAPKGKTISIKNKEANFLKRKFDNRVTDYGMVAPQYNEGHRKPFHEDISNRSSSGSAISNSESCAQYGTAEASDLTGPAQPVVWDSTVPSRKRTCVTRSKPSPVDLLTEDLYTIWNEQSSCLSVEDDLLPVTDEPMGSVEFGHGSVLIRQPSSMAREEESEASSFPVDHKQHTVSSQRMIFPGLKEETGVNSSIRGIKKPASQGVVTDRTRREEGQLEKFQTLAHHNSPLCLIDLQDIVNFDQFTNLLTNDEQQSLLKLLSPVDTAEPSLEASKANQGVLCFSRLKSMFDSPQLKENMLSFQKVLADGVFDGSLSGITKDDCKMLKKLLLGTAVKSKWVEQYKIFEESKGKTGVHESEVVGVFNNIPTNYSATKKRSQDGQPQKLAGAKVGMKNPKRILVKSNYEQKELIDDDENFLSAKRALSSHTNNGSLVLDSSHFMEDSSEQDLLIDLPCHSSFPQAELLLPITSFGAQASTSSSSVYPNAMRR